MPKVKIEYDAFEEREEMEDAINAWRYSLALHNIKQEVRKIWKYKDMSEDQQKIVDEIYEYICDQVHESRAEE